MAFTPITITGHYELPGGTPATGSVDFILSGTMKDTADKLVIVPIKQTVELDENGEFSIDLLASDDPTTVPQNVPYKVTENIDGAVPNSYQFVLPHDAPNGTLDISDVTQVTGQSAVYMLISILGGATPMPVTPEGGASGNSNESSRQDHSHALGLHAATHQPGGSDELDLSTFGYALGTDLTALTAVVAGKASQAALDDVNTALGAKADNTVVTAALAAKANVDDMNTALAAKANQATVDGLGTQVAAKEPEWTLKLRNGAYNAADHDIVVADYSGGIWATLLPAPAAGAAVQVVVGVPDPAAASGTLTPHAGETIHGTVSLVNQGDKVLVRTDGTDWFVV